MKLLIVESPGKIKKISELLGDEWIVVASVGHIIDLVSTNMSIDLKTFEPIYIRNSDKEKVIENIISKMLKVGKENVYLGSDEDREGEMIAWSLAKELKLTNCKRIVFNSITKKELENAVKNYKEIDINMVYAQQARRLLDRLAGYTLSPLLYKHGIKNASSAGRVQSVVVKIIADKEKEIQQFFSNKKDVFITVSMVTILTLNEPELKNKDNIKYNAQLCYDQTGLNIKAKPVCTEGTFGDNKDGIDNASDGGKGDSDMGSNKKIVKFNKGDTKLVLSILKSLSKCKHNLLSIENKIRKNYPDAPYTTSTMQQDMSRIYGMNSKKTMLIAQKLYESGHITYMRTDSTNISQEASFLIKECIIKKYGSEYYERRDYKNKKGNTQEAHECIRPTKINYEKITGSPDEQKLYNAIWKRTIKSQMKPMEFQHYTIETKPELKLKDDVCKGDKYKFIGTIEELIFDGYKIVDNDTEGTCDNDTVGTFGGRGSKGGSIIGIMNKLGSIGCGIDWVSIHANEETEKPPIRYNDATLINKMDPKNLNIGRPSTYASIIDKILERKYVEIRDIEGKQIELLKYRIDKKDKTHIDIETVTIVIGNEKKKLVPTECGIITTEFLEKNCNKLMDYNFTANMEKDLDLIAEGTKNKFTILNDFYTYLQKTCSITGTIDKNIDIDKNIVKAVGITLGTYKKKDIILNNGKYGKYISYGTNNYSLKEPQLPPGTEDPKGLNNPQGPSELKDLLEKAINLIKSDKKWKVNNKKYILRNGKYGYYLEEEGKKINISISKLVNIIKKRDNIVNDVDVIDKITKDDISTFINNCNV
jgi:DNA topoisomerase-1